MEVNCPYFHLNTEHSLRQALRAFHTKADGVGVNSRGKFFPKFQARVSLVGGKRFATTPTGRPSTR